MTIRAYAGDDFEMLFRELQKGLIEAPIVATGHWQSRDISAIPMMATPELRNVTFSMKVPEGKRQLADLTGAHLPWAEDHFQERVSGKPLNPAPSEEWWPFAQKVNADHKSEPGGKFSHTYPERMWPKYAGEKFETPESLADEPLSGIRFRYGDLDDVVNQIANDPLTRQAYLPIWFPEDTGAVHGKRVPCTLGYHFLIRDGEMQITYHMRSCDLIRHFQDDVYMAGRLLQWVVEEINKINKYKYIVEADGLRVGELIMNITSLHCFQGDLAMMKYRDGRNLAWNA